MVERYKEFDAAFRFFVAWLIGMRGFGHQNVIGEMIIARVGKKFSVQYKGTFGGDLKFECEKMEVTGVQISETEKARFVPGIEKLRTAVQTAKKRDKIEH